MKDYLKHVALFFLDLFIVLVFILFFIFLYSVLNVITESKGQRGESMEADEYVLTCEKKHVDNR